MSEDRRDEQGAPDAEETAAARPRIRRSMIPLGIGPGLVLAGTYEIVRALGEGAMGKVYLGRDVRLERDVAIKFIQPELVRSTEAHDRFLREARTMARVRNLNVVEIYAYGDHLAAPYIVMEYVRGDTLDGWMRKRGGASVSVDEVIGILDQACRGVAAIHKAGAVHRDLKPSNVLIGPAFRVCVTDLGLARVLDHAPHETTDTVSGTPAYMAPEVVLGTPLSRELEARADVYALGVIAFELLTGRLPFERDDATEMMMAHIDEPPPAPSELREDLPPAFDAVILGALVKDPHGRTPSASAFQRALLEARETASAQIRGLSILIADDDADFCALAEVTLRTAFPDADVIVVNDGQVALGLAERRAPTLALVDLDMPGLNGVELTASIRATPKIARMPILVATARGGAPDWRLLQSLGADGFIVKPIDPVSLIALVRRTLDQQR